MKEKDGAVQIAVLETLTEEQAKQISYLKQREQEILDKLGDLEKFQHGIPQLVQNVLGSQFTALTETLRTTETRLEKRLDKFEADISKKLDARASKEAHDQLDKRVKKVESWMQWVARVTGLFIVTAILAAVFSTNIK